MIVLFCYGSLSQEHRIHYADRISNAYLWLGFFQYYLNTPPHFVQIICQEGFHNIHLLDFKPIHPAFAFWILNHWIMRNSMFANKILYSMISKYFWCVKYSAFFQLVKDLCRQMYQIPQKLHEIWMLILMRVLLLQVLTPNLLNGNLMDTFHKFMLLVWYWSSLPPISKLKQLSIASSCKGSGI